MATTDNVTKILSVELKASAAIKGLGDLNEKIEENKAKLKEMANLNQKGSTEYARVEQQIKMLSRAKQVLTKETQNEVKAQTEEKGSINALRAELSNLTRQYDSLSKAERENSKAGKQLQKDINRVTNEIKAAEEGTQRYYRNVGNYQNAILSAVGLNNQYVQSLMLISSSSQGASGGFNALITGVKAFGRSLWGLMTNPAFLAIAGIAGTAMAFKWFYDYNVETERALRMTKEFTDLSGKELQWLRAEIQATANTYQKDFMPVLETVDYTMEIFGVDAQTAMQAINDGFQAGADISGNYLDLIKQYAPTFHDAGISLTQLIALITQTRQGIFSKEGLDAIKVGATRIREMSTTTQNALQGIGINTNEMMRKLRSGEMEVFDALQEVSRHLKEMPDNAQEVGEVMSAVFGRQGKFASQEMIEGLADIDTNLDNLKAKTGEYGEELNNNRQINADYERELASFFNVGDGGWELLKTRVDSFWKLGLTNAIKRTKDLLIGFKNLYTSSSIFRYLVKLVSGFGYVASTAASTMFNTFHQGFKAVGSWVDAFVNTFKSAFKAIQKMAQGVGDILSGNIEKGINEISSGWQQGINNALKGIKNALSTTRRAYASSVEPFMKGWDLPDKVIPNLNFENFGSGVSFFGGDDAGQDKSKEQLEQLLNDILNDKKPKGNGSPSGGGGGGSSSNRNATAEDEKKRLDNLAKQLLQQAVNIEMQAKRELSKLSEKGIEEYYAAQREELQKKYKDLGKYFEDTNSAEYKAYQILLNNLNTQEQNALKDFRANQKKQKLQAQIDAEMDAKKRLELQLQQIDIQQAAELEKIVENEELKNAVIAKYEKQRYDLRENFAKQQLEQQTKLAQLARDSVGDSEKNLKDRYEAELTLLQLQKQQELEQYKNNYEMRLAIALKYLQMEEHLQQEYADKEREIALTKYEALAAVTGGLSQLMAEFQDENKSALAASKILALAEIMISQAVAIANAVKAGSNAASPWQMIAQIAASVTAVTVAMVQAFKSLNSAKFATGGYVRGAGTGTSDSIPVRVSNGESIMNANTTAMFGGLLSSLNQLGGGVPIQVQQTAQNVRGEDMLARAVAKGVAMLPNPVVSVEDINRGQRQVEVMNQQATL